MRADLQACIATMTAAPSNPLSLAVTPPEAYAALLLPSPRPEWFSRGIQNDYGSTYRS